MNEFFLNQQIYTMQAGKKILEKEISDLQSLKLNITLEYTRKCRQLNQISEFYANKRTSIIEISEDLEGNTCKSIISKMSNIYMNYFNSSNSIEDYLEDIKKFLNINIVKIDSDILTKQNEIINCDNKIYELSLELSKLESEG